MIKEIKVCDICEHVDEEMNTVVVPIIKTDVVRAKRDGTTVAEHRVEKIENKTLDLCSDCNRSLALSMFALEGRKHCWRDK